MGGLGGREVHVMLRSEKLFHEPLSMSSQPLITINNLVLMESLLIHSLIERQINYELNSC